MNETIRKHLRTTTDAAEEVGVSIPRVKQLVKELGVGTKFGRDWAFTIEDVEAMKRRNTQVGRPGTTTTTTSE